LLVVGALVHWLRKQKAKGKLKIWQGFRKKKTDEHHEPSLDEEDPEPLTPVTSEE
jgi:hypothetical protein